MSPKLATLDRIDGGISILLHCPGYPVPTDIMVENISIDLYVTPREANALENAKHIAYLVQSFGENLVHPHLLCFTHRHLTEGKPSTLYPGMFPCSLSLIITNSSSRSWTPVTCSRAVLSASIREVQRWPHSRALQA